MLVDGPTATPNLDNFISDWFIGDTRQFNRTVPTADLVAGDAISDAYLTIKAAESDSDANAIGQLHITTALTNQGQITGPVGGNYTLLFNVFGTLIQNLNAGQIYYYDIRLVGSVSLATWIVENGQIQFRQNTTQAQPGNAPTFLPNSGIPVYKGFLGDITKVPAGIYNVGDYFRNQNPVSGAPSGWTCVGAGDETTSVWRTDGIIGDTNGV